MTEAELVEFIPLYIGTAQGSANTTFALVFGYIVAAHTAGASLTRAQVMVGTTIYIIGVSFSVATGIASGNRAAHFGKQLQAMKPEETIVVAQINPLFFYCVVLLFIGGSLWFMWSVRHRKSE